MKIRRGFCVDKSIIFNRNSIGNLFILNRKHTFRFQYRIEFQTYLLLIINIIFTHYFPKGCL